MTDEARDALLIKLSGAVGAINERTRDHSRRLISIERDAAKAAKQSPPPSRATALGGIAGAIGGGFVAALLQKLGWPV